ncbi:MAG: metallophosphoesterase [bacterium]|nr:metallophosphoesterase [bacterium]
MRRLVLRWLVLLDATLLLVALALAAGGSHRAYLLLAAVPVVFVPFSYARWRLHRALDAALGARHPRVVAAIGGAEIALDLVLVAQLLTARGPALLALVQGPVIGWIGPVWFSAHALLLLGYGVVGLARLAYRAAARVRIALAPPPPAPAGAEVLGRREFLQRAGVAGAALPFAAAFSGVPLSYDFRVEHRTLVVPGWPRRLDGLRVVHLSDIHVGGAMTRERLLRIAELTNAARPDLVAHTGDFLTHRSGDFDLPLYEALARVRAPLGQWACLGNHDYDDPARIVRRLGEAGVAVLRDRRDRLVVDGEPLEIAGADFVFSPTARETTYAALARAWGPPDAGARVLLNHDPSAFALLPDDVASLVLSGHTHGGHVGIQLGPSHALTVVGLLGLPDQGVFARGDMRLFVTRCVGFYGYPMRVGIPPEIAVLTLRTPDARSSLAPARADPAPA